MKHIPVIKWVETPRKCAYCNPKPSMMTRNSCIGCVKYRDKIIKEQILKDKEINKI